MKTSKGSLFAFSSLVFVIAGAIVLTLNSSNRGHGNVYRSEAEPVRTDPYAGIDPELLQAMKDMNSARDPEGRAMANKKLIAHAIELSRSPDAGKVAIKQELQGKSLNERLGFLEHGMDDYTLQEKVEIAFALEDLPRLYAALGELEHANCWWAAVMALAILEPDEGKAFESLSGFFERQEDWVGLRQRHPNWADTIAWQKYLAVSGFGYINSEEANGFLRQLMKYEQASELVSKSNGDRPGLIDVYESIWLIQASAAHGIMVTRNEELIPYLVDASIQAAEEFQKDHGVNSGRLTADIDAILAMHYYYKEHGWEGGYRLRATMDVPIYPEFCNVPARTYYDEYLSEYYVAQKVYKLQYERGLVNQGTKYYLEKRNR